MKYKIYDFPLAGRCMVAEEAGAVCMVYPVALLRSMEGEEEETPLLREAARQLKEYFSGVRHAFDLPLRPSGTEFQKQVWLALCGIPYGETVTYGQIAAAVGRPRGTQAVGQAVGANPIPFLIPCHRVVGKNGKLTGFALGLELKEALLKLEQI